jgi:excisionase family DNA binding protein
MSQLYTPLEVANIIRVDKETVLEWIRKGRLAVVRYGPRTYRVREKDLEAFTESNVGQRPKREA